uniref:Uncharacterized protein n=1 Tax=Rhizophora mucronata TaxID=61149 RepID=A0A2P2JDS0_RHIMU
MEYMRCEGLKASNPLAQILEILLKGMDIFSNDKVLSWPGPAKLELDGDKPMPGSSNFMGKTTSSVPVTFWSLQLLTQKLRHLFPQGFLCRSV